jgi:hypothetical protein
MNERKALVEALRIGDYITLNSLHYDSFLSAEGILVPDFYVGNDLDKFDDALFCVHLPRLYSAARELEDFMTTTVKAGEKIDDEGTLNYMKALQVLNDAMIRCNCLQ